jgi:hypothetical protein
MQAGVAEVPQVQLYYNVTVRDNSDNEQNFLFNHSVESTRIAAAVRDPVSRIELAREFTTPHIPEMLAAKHWKCAVCKEGAETVLLHPLSNQLGLDPPMLKDFGGVAVCGKLACQHQASEMMHTIFKQVMEASRIELSEDEGIIDVY